MKILVIDDERPTLSMFRLFLAAYGYEVHTASSGEDGLDLFDDIRPEIVFTDIRMPGMDGLEVLRRIRGTGRSCQVIIITGHGDMEMALAAMEMDASDFINKPVERKALDDALARAEKRSARKREQAASISIDRKAAGLILRVRGRLTASSEQTLEKIAQSVEPGTFVLMDFADDFSIDRRGMALLTEFLQGLSLEDGDVRMRGLSYNYIRFFEMAGIQRLAEILPTGGEDTGH